MPRKLIAVVSILAVLSIIGWFSLKAQKGIRRLSKAEAKSDSIQVSQAGQSGNPSKAEPPASLTTRVNNAGQNKTARVRIKLSDLPECRLKAEIAALPPETQSMALDRLSGFDTNSKDFNSLHVSKDGKLYYTCKDPMPQTEKMLAEEETLETTSVNSGLSAIESQSITSDSVPIANPPKLHSKPGAANEIYLDFNGGVVSGTSWGDTRNCLPVDNDGDMTTFSTLEQKYIVKIWEVVAEDYAPFDVDVTTEEPASYASNHIAHAMITPVTDADGLDNPHQGYGGIAMFDVFGDEDYATKTSPTFITSYTFTSFYIIHIADSVSHEIGHNLGLMHDGTSVEEYYPGHGTGNTSWAPIMGAASMSLVQWSKGEYYDASNTEDDFAIIASRLGLNDDDVSDTITGAKDIPYSKKDSAYTATGVIGTMDDVDVFHISLDYPCANIFVTPTCVNGTNEDGNCDIKAELLNSSGTVLYTFAPEDTTYLNETKRGLAAGDYYLCISNDSAGDPFDSTPTGYTRYGCLGKYSIKLTPSVDMPTTYKPVVGTNVTLTASIGGKNPHTYSWKRNNIPLDCKNSSLTISNVEYNDRGAYSFTSTDANGIVSSATTFLLPRLNCGKLRTWGYQPEEEVYTKCPTDLNDIMAISANEYYGAVLRNDGSVKIWGKCNDTIAAIPDNATDIVQICTSYNSVAALKSNGSVLVWGEDWSGCSNVPTITNAIAIAAGCYHVMALKSDGTVVAWGFNHEGQTDVPETLSNVCAIDAGEYYSLALKTDGTVVAWGRDDDGEIDVPATLTGVKAISAGSFFSLALKNDGTIASWGSGGEVPTSSDKFVSMDAGKNWLTGCSGIGVTSKGTVVDKSRLNAMTPADLKDVAAVSNANQNFCIALYDAKTNFSPFAPRDKFGCKWSTQWGWVDDTYYPWLYSYYYKDWMYLFDSGTLSVDNAYWIAFYTGNSYVWGYVYPKDGWYCMTSDNRWHWLGFTDPVPKSTL